MTRGAEKVYLRLEDGVRVRAESLEEAIESHPEVETVVLFWTWSREYYTSHASVFEAYVTESSLDEVYSFQGGREDALEFARSYGCWDGQDFLILMGDVLYGYNAKEDLQTSFDDGYDHVNGLGMGYDPLWFTWIRVGFDPDKNAEYLLSPDPIPKEADRWAGRGPDTSRATRPTSSTSRSSSRSTRRTTLSHRTTYTGRCCRGRRGGTASRRTWR